MGVAIEEECDNKFQSEAPEPLIQLEAMRL
jgi:hypothetical protein